MLLLILALDSLDLSLVREFECRSLMQVEYGTTDISEFDLERTVVLWASFLTGRNMEEEIPVKGQWEFTLDSDQTFLRFFNAFKVIDVPAFSYKRSHEEERKLLKDFFDGKASVEEYDACVWRNHEENKRELHESLDGFDLVLGYFCLADAVGHLSFGLQDKMRRIYEELDGLANQVMSNDDLTLVVSDHGMKMVGRYGDHTKNGFYSLNRRRGLGCPKITDFYDVVRNAGR